MNWFRTRFLVLDGNSRQCLPILKGLHEIGAQITTLNDSRLDNGFASRYPAHRLLKPTDRPLWDFLFDEVQKGHYDALLPLSDISTDTVTAHANDLTPFVRLPTPSRPVFLSAYNKQITMQTCMDENVPCPVTKRDAEDLAPFVRRIGFPLIAKPRKACGSKGLKIVRTESRLDSMISSGEIFLPEYVLQEFIPQTGRQYNVHLFMDDAQCLQSGMVTEKTRWYPVDGGASCLCRTIENKTVLEDCERLLRAIRWRGYAEIELVEDPRDGRFKVVEINGRASASIKIMDLAGTNVARQMAELAFGLPVTPAPPPKCDIRMRRLATDLLWFFQAQDRFARKPSWFSPLRTHEVVFSWKDPLPALASTLALLTHIGGYKREMKKRRRD